MPRIPENIQRREEIFPKFYFLYCMENIRVSASDLATINLYSLNTTSLLYCLGTDLWKTNVMHTLKLRS